jgi:hypothetical protein
MADLLGFTKEPFSRMDHERVISAVLTQANDLKVRAVLLLNHDPIAKAEIQAGGVDQIVTEGCDHAVLLTEPADFVIRKEHR